MTIPAAGHCIPPAPQLSVRLLHSFTEAEPFRLAWNGLVLASGVDVYQTFDWCRIWWQHYGAHRQLHLLLCFSREELVGLVPAFVETLWLGPIRLRVAKLVGADYSLHLCNLPVRAEALSPVMSQAFQYFLGTHRCDLLLLGPLSGPSARHDELLAAGRNETGLVASTAALGDSCNTYFHLPPTFDEYLKLISKQQRNNYYRNLRKFSRAYHVTFDVVDQPGRLVDEFEEFRRLHNSQWREKGKLGHFGDWPHAEAFNRDLVRTLGNQGLVRFYRILANNQVVSSDFCFVYGDTTYSRLPARARGADWDMYGVGRMGFSRILESSIRDGQRNVEAGRGHYEYKLQLGGREWPLRTLQFMRRGSGVSARVRAFRLFASWLHLAYYKVLFIRMAPRLPVLQRPLSRVWIRSTW